MDELITSEKPQWCPGCGNFGIHTALMKAISELGIDRKDVVIVTGIGCSGKSNHYINTYGYESIHGRSIPLASGVRLANHKLTVIAEGGDGDGYGIGSAHFLHSFRRNINMTYIVHDNAIYGLTTGQASPTTQKGMKTKSTPHGNLENPFNPISVAIASGGTFVARVFIGDIAHAVKIFKEAISHKGFSFVDVLQPCVSFNKLNTYDWWRKRVYKLEESGYEPNDRKKALEKAFEEVESNYERIPVGIFYKEEKETYEEQNPQIKEKPLIEHEPASKEMLERAIEKFM